MSIANGPERDASTRSEGGLVSAALLTLLSGLVLGMFAALALGAFDGGDDDAPAASRPAPSSTQDEPALAAPTTTVPPAIAGTSARPSLRDTFWYVTESEQQAVLVREMIAGFRDHALIFVFIVETPEETADYERHYHREMLNRGYATEPLGTLHIIDLRGRLPVQ